MGSWGYFIPFITGPGAKLVPMDLNCFVELSEVKGTKTAKIKAPQLHYVYTVVIFAVVGSIVTKKTGPAGKNNTKEYVFVVPF